MLLGCIFIMFTQISELGEVIMEYNLEGCVPDFMCFLAFGQPRQSIKTACIYH